MSEADTQKSELDPNRSNHIDLSNGIVNLRPQLNRQHLGQ